MTEVMNVTTAIRLQNDQLCPAGMLFAALLHCSDKAVVMSPAALGTAPHDRCISLRGLLP